jgi:protein gp37
MADKTGIEWTEATWNPITGCSKVSQGCKNCYALREWPRMAGNPGTVYFGREFTDVRCHPERLDQPIRWKRPRRIFVNSMSDLFHEQVPDEFIAKVFEVMWQAKQHTFQILTKRPERMLDWISKSLYLCNDPLPNVWLGVSIEDQASADERIPLLLETPAAVRWISAEPLLGPVDLGLFGTLPRTIAPNYTIAYEMLRWVVVGGESGNRARPMHPDWVRNLRDQCIAADVPFLFKQWGEWVPRSSCYHTFEDGLSCSDYDPGAQQWPCIRLTEAGHDGSRLENIDGGDDAYMQRVGKKMAGRRLDGRTWNEYPRG